MAYRAEGTRNILRHDTVEAKDTTKLWLQIVTSAVNDITLIALHLF
jgi:hypothetical protein